MNLRMIYIPKRYRWLITEGRNARRAQLAAGDPDDLSATYRAAADARAERERVRKLRRTMDIAHRLHAGENIPARWPRR
jgi:hypothetical protein